MNVKLIQGRYLEFYDGDSKINITKVDSEGNVTTAGSVDLGMLIGLLGPKGDRGYRGYTGKSAKEILIDGNVINSDATDADFYEAIKGDTVAISNVELIQNIQQTFIEQCTGNVCKLVPSDSGTIRGTGNKLRFTFSDGTTKEVTLAVQNGEQYVTMLSSTWNSFLGSTTLSENQLASIKTYTKNGTTIKLVPLNIIELIASN